MSFIHYFKNRYLYKKKIDGLINQIGELYREIRNADNILELMNRQKKPAKVLNDQTTKINKLYEKVRALRNTLDTYAPLTPSQEQRLNNEVSP